MRKHNLISEEAFKKFKIPEDPQSDPKSGPQEAESPGLVSPLKHFKERTKRLNRVLDPEYLRFDSTIESGNLERVEAFPLNHKNVEICRASNQLVVQKYNLFCKVDTNTKGH